MPKELSDTLVIIPARGGSKGLPKKNIKKLNGKPLIAYTLEAARKLFLDESICVSTDDDEIVNVLKELNYTVPFKRPDFLAQDNTSTYEVLLHALNFYEVQGNRFSRIILLQPTSPFRTGSQIVEALELYDNSLDMVVSVKETMSNPYFNLFEENGDGLLFKSKEGDFVRRQDCPTIYEYNGAIYIINVESLRLRKISQFEKIKKYVMDDISSIDIDTNHDWFLAEEILRIGRVNGK